jgi:S-adenosylmethionine:tRNA-ribosyltransferase-isomerase (queuine synthetase)
MWRKIGQAVYYEIGDNIKINLLLVVNSSKILHYKLSTEATNSTNFESFMTELIQKLTPEEKSKYTFF